MTARVLGISAFYHDSAAALVRGGEIVAAAQEERFSRVKNDRSFPDRAIQYCLEAGEIEPEELDAVVFHEHPLPALDRVVRTFAAITPGGEEAWAHAARSQLGEKLRVAEHVRRTLGREVPLHLAGHHRAHAASAFYPSPFSRAAVLTVDGVGEWATTTLSAGEGARIDPLLEIRFPHSLGLLYAAFTAFCGFQVHSGEHKLMGLAAYGRPRFERRIRDHLIDLREDGSFRLDLDRFTFLGSDRMTGPRFDELFGGPPRAEGAEITERERDLAASVQAVVEDAVLRLARHARRETGCADLCMAGGVALNGVANGRVLREKVFDRVWVQPAAGDAGCALGAALWGAHALFSAPRVPADGARDGQRGSLLGPAFSSAEVAAFLEREGVPHHAVPDPERRADEVAAALERGEIVAVVEGRMEFGPRALGARSILADPRDPGMQRRLNAVVKRREGFRPFAPAVLRERAAELFDLAGDAPYMLFVAPARGGEGGPAGTPIPAAVHVDGSARVQTVGAESSPGLHRLLRAFERRTGCPVLVNTSFNVRDEPIVCSLRDALRCFLGTDIDLLVLEDVLVHKRDLPARERDGTEGAPRRRPHGWRARWRAARAERAARRFAARALAPAGRALRARGAATLDLRPDPARATYYLPARHPGALPPAEALVPGHGLAAALDAYWRAEGVPELAALAPALEALAGGYGLSAGAPEPEPLVYSLH